ITIHWTGKLHVVPIDRSIDPDMVPGKAAVSFYGSPVKLMRNGSESTCGVAHYNSADGSGALTATTEVPIVTIKDSRGSIVNTPQVQYSEPTPGHKVAVLTGASSARIPTTQSGENPQMLVAAWQETCTLHLLDD